MPAPEAITSDWLRSRSTCSDQVELFEATFGESAPLTRANLLLASRAGLGLVWLASQLLDDQAWSAFEAATVTAWLAFEAAKAPARSAFEAEKATARSAYQAATATALADALGLPVD